MPVFGAGLFRDGFSFEMLIEPFVAAVRRLRERVAGPRR
jgi:hypothetical protein